MAALRGGRSGVLSPQFGYANQQAVLGAGRIPQQSALRSHMASRCVPCENMICRLSRTRPRSTAPR